LTAFAGHDEGQGVASRQRLQVKSRQARTTIGLSLTDRKRRKSFPARVEKPYTRKPLKTRIHFSPPGALPASWKLIPFTPSAK
jgi:hypothetical protein